MQSRSGIQTHLKSFNTKTITKKQDTPQGLADQIADIKNVAEKVKVKLTPEIERYIRSHLQSAQGKLERGEKLTHADLAFMEKARGMIAAERFKQIELAPQYGKRLETLKFFGFLGKNGKTKEGDAPFPPIEKAIDSFTPEELVVAKDFQEPTLLLIPETSFATKVAAIDGHTTMEDQINTFGVDIFTKSDSGTKRISGWKIVIVDGANEMEPKKGDDTKLEYGKRIEKRKKDRNPVEKGMERHAYALLMMESLRNGEPIDKDTYTLLDDDHVLSASGVPYGSWDHELMSFFMGNPRLSSVNARLRSSVGENVLL